MPAWREGAGLLLHEAFSLRAQWAAHKVLLQHSVKAAALWLLQFERRAWWHWGFGVGKQEVWKEFQTLLQSPSRLVQVLNALHGPENPTMQQCAPRFPGAGHLQSFSEFVSCIMIWIAALQVIDSAIMYKCCQSCVLFGTFSRLCPCCICFDNTGDSFTWVFVLLFCEGPGLVCCSPSVVDLWSTV